MGLDKTSWIPDLRVVVHDVMEIPGISSLGTTVRGFEVYSQRGLLFLDDRSMVCVSGDVDLEWLEYFSDLLGIRSPDVYRVEGKELTANLIEDRGFIEQIKGRGKKILLFPFYYSWRVETLQRRLEEEGLEVKVCGISRDEIDAMNSKVEAKLIFMKCGVPVPEGMVIPREELEASREIIRLLKLYGDLIIRGSEGASGSSLATISDEDEIRELERVLREDEESGSFLVEKKYRVISSPNVQIQVTPEKEKILLTEQVLYKDVHKGNLYPPMKSMAGEEIMRYSRVVADYMKRVNKSGYTIAGIDFIITPEGVMAIEINPRVNGSMYPEFLRERLGFKAFISSQVEDLEPFDFNELNGKLGDFMEPGKKAPVMVPIIPGLFGMGKIYYVILGESREEVLDVKREFEEEVMRCF